MRLGLLGPAGAKESDLARGARFLFEDAEVDRAIYLGVDAALDSVVRSWAEKLVGGDPGDPALWRRAAERCVSASSAQIHAFLSSELERRKLKVFQSLPGDGTRVIELLNGKVVVMIYDKAHLDEEDILSASVLVFGKSDAALVKQIGSRWFLSPGPVEAGVMTLEDQDDGIHVARFDAAGRELSRELLLGARATKLKVKSASGQ